MRCYRWRTMKRTKSKPVTVAPFNLRTTGPMKPSAIRAKLAAAYKLASAKSGGTLDADPCPHCGAKVEWAATSARELGKTVPYVYARCQGTPRHGWGFSNAASRVQTMTIRDVPLPRPSNGTIALSNWIDRKEGELKTQMQALEELKRLSTVVVLGVPPPPQSSPNHH